jgi:hypothetical protein
MAMTQCKNGHFYDNDKHMSCPHCGVPNINVGSTKPVSAKPGSVDTPTRPRDATQPPAQEPGATVGLAKKKLGIDPVVGWLVCVSGPEKGRDYRIRSENNFIGRDRSMDICISGDSGISRSKHAAISYDPKYGKTRVLPGGGRGLTYCNEEVVDAPTQLNAFDKIEIGETTLIFVPFCGEQFKWETN